MSGSPSSQPDSAHTIACELCGRSQVEFTPHSLVRMRERGVSLQQVIETVRSPDVFDLPVDQESDAPPRFRYRSFLSEDMALDVVFEDLPDRILILSTFFKRKRLGGRW